MGRRRKTRAGLDVLDALGMSADQVVESLSSHMSEDRKRKIDQVIGRRTRAFVCILEGLYDQGNISAVMRSAEALGFLDLHIIEGAGELKEANRITQGADKWLRVQPWSCVEDCAVHLQSAGYRILTTDPVSGVPLSEVDFTIPTAMLFGNEHAGISDAARSLADAAVYIPMDGFVQSFNISVAAAIALYHVRDDRIRRQGYHGDLDEQERQVLRALYYLRSVKRPKEILERYRSDP